jgi:hypothetical protein
MKVLISSIGSGGDVQPILALAIQGPDLKQLTGGTAPKRSIKPSAEQLQQLAVHTIRSQFPVLTDAARGCDLVVRP